MSNKKCCVGCLPIRWCKAGCEPDAGFPSSSAALGAGDPTQVDTCPGHTEEMRVSISADCNSTTVSPVLKNCTIATFNITTTVGESSTRAFATKDVSPQEEIQTKIKLHLKRKYELVFEGIAKRGCPSKLLNIYTDLYITKGEREVVNVEHEVWHVETAAKKPDTNDIALKCNDIFKSLAGPEEGVRCVLTKGIAGIGKTISIQKFVFDWAEFNANPEINFVFPIPFRELNLIKPRYSLFELICHFFPQMAEIQSSDLNSFRILFIFDGLDESRLSLNFESEIWCNINAPAPVGVLITNLIKGNLLPHALLWITSRPAAVNQIPPDCVHLMTEIRGFTDPQKDDYFRKRFKDEKIADKVIDHVKKSRSLYIMCHMPVFCWISATVLEIMLTSENSQKPPTTLTEMYTHLLLLQTNIKNQKYYGKKNDKQKCLSESDIEIIIKLGQLAFQELKKSNWIFYKDDLKECGIEEKSASLYSGVFTEIFKEEYGMYEEKCFCFVHLSIQEYLAALFVHFKYTSTGENLLSGETTVGTELFKLHQSAVSLALKSENGHLDLFLRFLLGISVKSNQKLLLHLLGENSDSDESYEKTITQIKQEVRKNPSPERTINLFHCLNELNDNSLVEEIQTYVQSGSLSDVELSPDQCSALAYLLLMSTDVLEDFDLTKYNAKAVGLRRLLPVLKFCRKACLNHCNLTKFLMEPVLQVIESPNSALTHLDLGYNRLADTGVKQLCKSLKKASSLLQELCLGDCDLTGSSCDDIAPLLTSSLSKLRNLELRGNDLGDSGVIHLCKALKESCCQLQRLGLLGCRVTEVGCASLASALRSNPSHLRELNLSYNHPGASEEELRAAAGQCAKLETLIMEHGGPQRDRPGITKYTCQLSLDPNTVNSLLFLSEENRKVTHKGKHQYPDHPERFEDNSHVLCKEGLSGRCYWEVEWDGGGVDIAVAYRTMERKGRGTSLLGFNNLSWNLHFPGDVYVFFHNEKSTRIQAMSAGSRRVGVYLDWPAGVLAFYRITKSALLLHRVITKFSEPLYPAFSASQDYSLSICTL